MFGHCHYSGLKQAAPLPFSSSSFGTDIRHRVSVRLHLGEKWQPGGSSFAAGTWPGIDVIGVGRVLLIC
ncbi:MAG: hypothetical protein OES90_05970, partial [Xanthomonadales bacterium]|nr:hypothetical protein [Xanthomonadales bacterium]